MTKKDDIEVALALMQERWPGFQTAKDTIVEFIKGQALELEQERINHLRNVAEEGGHVIIEFEKRKKAESSLAQAIKERDEWKAIADKAVILVPKNQARWEKAEAQLAAVKDNRDHWMKSAKEHSESATNWHGQFAQARERVAALREVLIVSRDAYHRRNCGAIKMGQPTCRTECEKMTDIICAPRPDSAQEKP